MKRLGRILLRWSVRAGWAVIALAVALALAESLGAWAWAARRWLASELGRPGAEVRIETLRLSWLRPRLELEGVELGPPDAAVRIDAAILDFDLIGRGSPRLVRARIDGGGLDLSRKLLVAWQPERAAGDMRAIRKPLELLPEIELRDIELAVRSESLGRVPLGRMHVLLRADEAGKPQLWGRLDPSPALGGGARSAAVFLRGALAEDDAFEVRATATALRLRADELPEAPAFESLRAAKPEVRLDVDLRGRIPFAPGAQPQVQTGLRLAGGSVTLLDGRETIEDLALELRADWHPVDETRWTDWSSLDLLASWSGTTSLGKLRGGAVCGTHAGDEQAALWCAGDEVRIGEPLRELLAHDALALRQWNAFEPDGTAFLRAAWRLPRGVQAADARFDAALELSGGARAAFRGWPGGTLNTLGDGFPLPLLELRGAVFAHHDPRSNRPLRVGVADLRIASRHGAATVALRATGDARSHAKDASPFAPGRGIAEFDLRIAADGLPFGAATEAALRGLSASIPPDSTWLPYHPRGGTIDAKVHVARTVAATATMVTADLELRGLSARWDELPIPLDDVGGRFLFRSDGNGQRGLSFDLEAKTSAGNQVRVRGRMQTDDDGDPRTAHETDETQIVTAESRQLVLGGADVAVLAASVASVKDALDELAPRGSAAFSWSRRSEGRDAASTTRVIVRPRADLVLAPKTFPLPVSDIAGSATILVAEDGKTQVRALPLAGRVQDSALAAFEARLPSGAMRVRAAGVDIGDPLLWHCMRTAWDGASGADAVQFTGKVDADGSFMLGGGDSRWSVHPRGASFSSGAFALKELRGTLELAGRDLAGRDLEAQLGASRVGVQELAWKLEAGAPLVARFSADLPLDREHLSAFVDGATLDALLDGLQLRGALSVSEGRVELRRGAAQSLLLSGTARPRGVSLRLGVPFAVDDAELQVERLSFDEHGVKALVRANGLRGRLAERAIDDVRLVLTYVGDQLTIDEWDGRFEGGRLRGMGDESRRATVLGLALKPPYPFQLALQLDKVEVGGLLRGLAPGRGGLKGLVDAQLSANGELEKLLGIRGNGSIALRESRLWAVPVFRELLGELGLDAGVVFDSLSTSLAIADGRVRMDGIRVRSPLLELAGAGTLDFDGALDYELGLTYGLVDRLGPVTQALYWLQNKLLAVTIAGDMAQPLVRIQNPLGNLLRTLPRRQLPKPELSPMPARF